MDLVIDGLWKTSAFVAQSTPLRAISSLRREVKSAPRKILERFCKNALETPPAELLAGVIKPSCLNELCEKVPIFDNVWKKLNVPPIEWYNYLVGSSKPHPNEDIGLTPVEMIKRNGYPVEVYEDIVTDDGYIVEVYRIPHGRANKTDAPKPVVFLVHGYITSSADFLVAGPDKAIAYMLADLGYDVWLGNPRGSIHSRKHAWYNPECDKEFWNFSFHEIGIYDLPAMIDFILGITQQETLTYIGMSQGSTEFFTLTSEKPEYNEKINLMVALAPVAHLSGAFYLLNKLGPVVRHFLNHARDFSGPREFPHKVAQKALSALHNRVQSEGFLQDVVIRILFTLFGPNHHQLDKDLLPVLLSTTPHNGSLNQILHFAQIAISERFQKFDHGSKINSERYGYAQPPDYNLNNVVAPVALFYSNGDLLSNSKDVMRLYNALPNCVRLHEIEDQNFSHMDYIIAIDVVPLLQRHIIKVVQEYNPCRLAEQEMAPKSKLCIATQVSQTQRCC